MLLWCFASTGVGNVLSFQSRSYSIFLFSKSDITTELGTTLVSEHALGACSMSSAWCRSNGQTRRRRRSTTDQSARCSSWTLRTSTRCATRCAPCTPRCWTPHLPRNHGPMTGWPRLMATARRGRGWLPALHAPHPLRAQDMVVAPVLRETRQWQGLRLTGRRAWHRQCGITGTQETRTRTRAARSRSCPTVLSLLRLLTAATGWTMSILCSEPLGQLRTWWKPVGTRAWCTAAMDGTGHRS